MEDKPKYKVLLYPEGFVTKSLANKNIAKVKRTITQHADELTINELAGKVGRKGQPVALCEAVGSGALTKKHWKSQQIYMLDFDNKDDTGEKLKYPYYLTGMQAVRISRQNGLTPAFGYQTLSNAKDYEKFRLVYVLDKPVTTKEEHEAVYARLSAPFVVKGVRLTDDSCRDCSRIFFGGTSVFGSAYNSVLSKDKLVEEGSKLIEADNGDASKASVQYNDSALLIQNIIEDLQSIQKGEQKSRENLKSPVMTRVQEEEADGEIPIYIIDIDYRLSYSPQKKIPKPLDFTGDFEGYVQFCLSLPWNLLLGVQQNVSFCCVLPEHDDKSASAKMSMYEGSLIYKCFADTCGVRMNVFEFLRHISGCSFITVCRYLALVFNMTFETDWQRQVRESVSWYRTMLISNHYASEYGVLMDYLDKRKLKGLYMCMLDIMMYMVHTGQAVMTDRLMFYIGGSFFYNMLCRVGYDKSYSRSLDGIKELEHLGLIEAVADEDIPPRQLARLRRIQQDKDRQYRMSCYHIPIDSPEVLQRACEVIKEDKANNVRAHAKRTRDGIMMISGKEAADKIFVQQTNEDVTVEIPKFYERYKKAIRNLFAKKGWTTEREIIDRMHYLDKKKRTVYSAFCLPDMIKHDLVQVMRFSKDVESTYGIDNKKAKLHYGSSKVIVPGAKWN